MKKKQQKTKKTRELRLWVKITLIAGAVFIAGFCIAPLLMKYQESERKKPITKGMIDSLWIEMPRHDVRLRSPGVWEEAWLDTTYFLRLRDINGPRRRTVIINEQMYWKCRARPLDIVDLDPDSSSVAEKQAKWDADSIKYKDELKRIRDQKKF